MYILGLIFRKYNFLETKLKFFLTAKFALK